jgi:hypothetical protein
MFHINFPDFVAWVIAKNASDLAWALIKAAIVVISSFVSIVGLACTTFRKRPSETHTQQLAVSNANNMARLSVDQTKRVAS